MISPIGKLCINIAIACCLLNDFYRFFRESEYIVAEIEVFEQDGKYFTTYNYGEILSALNDTFDIDLDAKYFMSKYLNKLFKKKLKETNNG